jgi:molybdopterin molybdotransferase
MISVQQAQVGILGRAPRNPPQFVLADRSVGLVLAEPVVADMDSPPFDKSLVDGFAVRASDLDTVPCELQVVEEVMAGQVPSRRIGAGEATRIMTGAPIPPGSDAVVMVEQAELRGRSVRMMSGPVRVGQHILRRGKSTRLGDVVLPAGHVLRPLDVGLLCEAGRTMVLVHRAPGVAILATGNELVPADHVPAAGQIRNSNGPMLGALSRAAHAHVVPLGICPDDRDALRVAILRGLEHDVLLISGGVSAGLLDLVPHMLRELGVEEVFHGVYLKPGKPLWFGVHAQGARQTCIFGLPGNPVGGLVCFELFVAPLLRKITGGSPRIPELRVAQLGSPYRHHSDRPTYFPVRVERSEHGRPVVTPIPWQGSADQRALGWATALAFLPPGDCSLDVGAAIAVHVLGDNSQHIWTDAWAEPGVRATDDTN